MPVNIHGGNTTDKNEDSFTIDYSKRKAQTKEDGQVTMEDMQIQHGGHFTRLLSKVVGPAFIFCGMIGFVRGIYISARTIPFRNRPKKLIITSVVNTVGKRSSEFANLGAALGLLYCVVNQVTFYMFDEELETLNDLQRQLFLGFLTGAIFKSSRGLRASLFFGSMTAGAAAGVYFYQQYKKNKRI
jgi:hypothetical protein